MYDDWHFPACLPVHTEFVKELRRPGTTSMSFFLFSRDCFTVSLTVITSKTQGSAAPRADSGLQMLLLLPPGPPKHAPALPKHPRQAFPSLTDPPPAVPVPPLFLHQWLVAKRKEDGGERRGGGKESV